MSKKGLKKVVREKAEDLTREVDVFSERFIVKTISKRTSCMIISEELGTLQIGSSPKVVVVLDPLDGTTNFANSVPFYGISACGGFYTDQPHMQDLSVGVVIDVISGETFYSRRGLGAQANDVRLGRPAAKREETLISLYSYGKAVDRNQALSLQIGLPEVKFRSLGSAALELCYVAAGRLDAFVDIRNSLRLVDVAAAKVILEESGGIFTDLQGNEVRGRLEDLKQKGMSVIAAGGSLLHGKLLEIVGQ